MSSKNNPSSPSITSSTASPTSTTTDPTSLNRPSTEPDPSAPANYQREIYSALRPPTLSTKPHEWESRARALLPAPNYHYIAGAASSGATHTANRAAFDRYRLRPRMLADATRRDLRVTLFAGTRWERKLGGDAGPLMLAPVGVQQIAHESAEDATARASGAAGVPMVLSSAATRTIEAVAAAQDAGRARRGDADEGEEGKAPRWFQLYWPKPQAEDVTISLLARARRSGFDALVVTLDTFTLGWRPEDLDAAYLPFVWGQGCQIGLSDPAFNALYDASLAQDTRGVGAKLGELWGVVRRPGSVAGALGVLRHAGTMRKSQAWLNVMNSGTYREWGHLEVLKKHWDGPIVLKGIQTVEDAHRAIECGMDGIVVSNHGGRQVDGAVASLDALAEIGADERVQASGITLLFDSGVRTGSDVLKAIALGAKAVLIGRPYMYGLAMGGEEGVKHVVKCILADMDITLGNIGKKSLAELSRDDLWIAGDMAKL